MITILKLASISAVLSAGVVTAYEAPRAMSDTTTKVFHDRILPETAGPTVYADASKVPGMSATANDASPAPDCSAQTWPYVARDCIAGAEGAPARKVVRTITVERRDAPNTSTLVRLPVAAVASR